MAAFTQSFVQGSAPTLAQGVAVGDLWFSPGANVLKVCVAASSTAVAFAAVASNPSPAVVAAIPAGGTGAAAGGWDTAPNRDTAITAMNAVLAALRTGGFIA